jgi:hypothetical protein
MSNPVLFDVTGSGDSSKSVWDMQRLGPLTMAIPNRLTFSVENVQSVKIALSIFRDVASLLPLLQG